MKPANSSHRHIIGAATIRALLSAALTLALLVAAQGCSGKGAYEGMGNASKAQDAPSTDATAPEAPEPNVEAQSTRAPSSSASAGAVASVRAREAILSQTDLRPDADGCPAGWRIEAWNRPRVKLHDKSAPSFLRIEQTQSGGYNIIKKSMALQPEWQALTFSVNTRVCDLIKGNPEWKMSRIEPVFRGQTDLAKPPVIDAEEGADWQTHTATWNVPEGASSLELMIGFWESSGVFDLSDMQISVEQKRAVTARQREAFERLTLGGREPQTLSSGGLFARLKKEFASAGPAYFVAGTSEADSLSRLKGGQPIDVPGQPFTRAMRVVVDAKKAQPWMANMQMRNAEPIFEGDTVLVVFYARGTKGPQKVDDGQGAVVQPIVKSHAGGGGLTSFESTKELTDEWQRFWITSNGPVPRAHPAGTVELLIMLGHKAQTVELGGLAWMVFPRGSDITRLPKRGWDYYGRSADAPWRAEARARIDKYRKADVAVNVVDRQGQPVRGATVKVTMTRHAFRFGTALAIPTFHGDDGEENAAKYKEIIRRHFNAVVLENALKWKVSRDVPAFGMDRALAAAEWAKAEGLGIRGHVLVWPSIHHTPAAFRDLQNEQLRKAVRDHVNDFVTKMKGFVDDWDVTNETNGNRDYMDMFGSEEMVEWYRIAHRADPSVKLTFNEPSFGMDGMETGSFPEDSLGKHRGWVDYLVKKGAPLDRLGCQAHGGRVGTKKGGGPMGLWEYYDTLHERYGKKLLYTELDVSVHDDSDPEQLAYQADVLRDTITIAFAHPAFVGIMQWGFWEGRHWLPKSALWRKDWSIKPNGQAFLDLVYDEWWTDEKGTTNAEGSFGVRGFLGSYEITVAHGGSTKTVRAELAAPGSSIRVAID